MTKKRKGKAAFEFLRYPGLGFVLDESSPAPAAKGRAFGVHFVPPAAYVSSLVSKGRPEEGATNIDVPLSPWTHGVKDELCSDAPTTVPLPEEENLDQDTKGEPRQEDPPIYVPQELKIPLRKDGQPGMWCMYHRSDRHSLEDCRQFNDIQIRQKNGDCYSCGEPGHISRDCPLNKKPKKAKGSATAGVPQKGRSFRTFANASTQTEEPPEPCPLPAPPQIQSSQGQAAASWDQTFICGDVAHGEWDLPGHIVTIQPGPSGLLRSTRLLSG